MIGVEFLKFSTGISPETLNNSEPYVGFGSLGAIGSAMYRTIYSKTRK